MSFAASSENAWLEDGHILHAQCKNIQGTLVDSTIDLDHHIGNSDGWFMWDGVDFSHSAEEIALRDGHHLEAQLRKIDGYHRDRQGINLNDRISNVDGKLTYVGVEGKSGHTESVHTESVHTGSVHTGSVHTVPATSRAFYH